MSSKRDVSSSSINGRYPSLDDNGEDAPPARGDSSRNYFLNVRPENRQTFCTIIAQITEETQPGFETTLKSHAVCEDSDVKFTCIVTGHPAPEITWYKDDKEMDRYCGLPKYQIFRYGKKHSLQLYKCTEDDAAVYQASARNNKGIVSCSGVLEVGTMNEYQIHQRWFARIKQKAVNKRRELDESRARGKENVAHAANAQRRDLLRTVSPERPQRKRKSQGEAHANSPGPLSSKEDSVKVRIPDLEAASHENMAVTPRADTTDKPTAPAPEVQNGYLTGPQGVQLVAVKDGKPPANNSLADLVENGISFSDYLIEAAELVARPTGKEFTARKKKRRLSEEEGELLVGKAEDIARGICDESALNGVDRSKDTGISSQCLPDTLKRNKSRGDPQPFKSGDYMEIDEHVSSVMLGRRQHSVVPSSPKGVHTSIEKDLSPLNCQSAKDTESEVTDANSAINQEPTYSSPQSPVYFSMKDMYFETIQEPKEHKQPQLLQVTETNDEASSQLQDRTNPQEALSGEGVDAPYLTGATPTSDPKQGEPSEDLRNMETSGTEMDIAMPCARSEIQNKDTFDNSVTDAARQSSDVKESSNSNEPSGPGISYVNVSGKVAQEDFDSPVGAVDPTPQPTFQPLRPPAVIQPPEDKAKASPPLAHGEPAEGPKPASPTQQLAGEALSETVGCKEQVGPDVSPVSERVEDVRSVGAFNGEWEKLDLMNISEQYDGSDEQPAPETATSEGTRPGLGGCPDEGTLPPQNEEETQPAAGRRNQFTQTVCQPGPDLKSDVEAMEATTAAPAGDHVQIVDVPPNSREGSIPVDNVPPEAKKAAATAGQQVVTQPLAEGTLVDVALSFVEENVAEAMAADEKVPEEMIAEIEGELLKVDRAEDAGPEEHVQGDVPTDSFGANLVEKFLSYLKIPSFLLGEKSSIISVGKPETTPNISPAPELHSHNKVTNASQPTKEVTDPYKSLPTATQSLLEEEVVHTPPNVLLASTEILHITEEAVFVGPLVGTAVDRVELDVMSLPSIVEESAADSFTSASPLMKTSLDPALPAVAPPSLPEHDRTTDVSGIGDTQSSLHPTTSVTVVALENVEVSHTELNRIVAPKDPSVGGATTLLPTLDVKSLADAEEWQDLTAFPSTEGKTDKNIAPCLVGTVEESSAVKEVTGGGSKQLEVTYIPSNEKVPAPKPVTPSTEEGMSGGDLQVTKSISDTRVAEVSQVPSIVVDNVTFKNMVTASIEDNEAIKVDIPAVPLLQGSSAKVKLNDAPPIIPSATPAELASGARRKIFLPRSKQLDGSEVPASDALNLPTQPKKEEGVRRTQHAQGDASHTEEESSLFPLSPRRSAALLQSPVVQQTMPVERRSPTVSRKMSMLEVPKLYEEPGDTGGISPLTKGETAKDVKSASVKTEVKTEEVKSTKNPFKAPQVIRKIRAEQFSDASGNMKFWCQFFNVLSDSTITWQKDGLHLDKLKRSAGDESQVSLAIVQASAKDCGVYRCAMENEYGSDATDFLFSSEVLSGFISREEIEVGEEIEMMPMLISKSLSDAGSWGNKLFGRIMTKELHVGAGFRRKASRAKVIYGLEPIFESGAACIIKVRNCISYGTKSEHCLIASNHDITMQECKLQNTAREYSKIFAAEARVIETFGPVPEVIPLHLLYRPANNIPYATIEKDLNGQFMMYSMEDRSKNLTEKSGSEVELKCYTFQHWIYQWTNGNLLITDLQGVGLKITDVQIATNSKGYQGLTGNCSSSVIEEFAAAHQCNRYCEALGLKSLKSIDSLQPFKPKAKSPLMPRKAHSTQSSPQAQRKGQSSPLVQRKGQASPLAHRKGLSSPQASRKSATSPSVVRKAGSAADNSQQTVNHKTVEIPKSVKLR